MATLIDGRRIAEDIRAEIRADIAALSEHGITPGLAVVMVGDDPASLTYAHSKRVACEKLGIYSEEHFLPRETSQEAVIALIRSLNADNRIDGILVEMPLPEHLDKLAVTSAIAPEKDIDCCSPTNIGRVFMSNHDFAPCTPAGCMELLDRSGVELEGKSCVVIGRSNFVGKPMAMLLMERHATITVCHSRTVGLPDITRRADVLVSAVGRARFITADMVRPGAVVIDIGTNRDENGKLCGDVDFAAVEPVASLITPVPGGVGPMTVTVLLRNTVKSAIIRRKKA